MEETEKTYTAWGLDEGEHEAQGLKPMLTPEGQVELLKAKGVTFDRCSEEQAIEALSGRDTFLHNIIYLCAHKFISLGNFFVLFNSGYIYISQRPDFLFISFTEYM